MAIDIVLFLYEGETEGEFYQRIIQRQVQPRSVVIKKKCLKGNFSINQKVADAIDTYIVGNAFLEYTIINVFVAYDREGKRGNSTPFSKDLIEKKFVSKNYKIKVVEIIATQDLESWLFIDIENIYSYLKAPKQKRNTSKYSEYENFDNRDLTRLFKSFSKVYRKGKKVEGLLEQLDLEKIYQTCSDLRAGIEKLKQISENSVKRKAKTSN